MIFWFFPLKKSPCFHGGELLGETIILQIQVLLSRKKWYMPFSFIFFFGKKKYNFLSSILYCVFFFWQAKFFVMWPINRPSISCAIFGAPFFTRRFRAPFFARPFWCAVFCAPFLARRFSWAVFRALFLVRHFWRAIFRSLFFMVPILARRFLCAIFDVTFFVRHFPVVRFAHRFARAIFFCKV